jgi:hypothetical protein
MSLLLRNFMIYLEQGIALTIEEIVIVSDNARIFVVVASNGADQESARPSRWVAEKDSSVKALLGGSSVEPLAPKFPHRRVSIDPLAPKLPCRQRSTDYLPGLL